MRFRIFSILFFLCGFSGAFSPAYAEELGTSSSSEAVPPTVAVAPAPAEPLILRMSDGRFYHPPSGKMAATREDLLWIIQNNGVSVPSTTVAPPVPVIEPVVAGVPLKNAIMRARQLLNDAIAGDKVVSPAMKYAASEADWRPITLAIWNRDTDQISVVTGLKNGKQLKLNQNVNVAVKRTNGLNSEFSLDREGKSVVVAVRYPILKEVTIEKKKKYEMHDVVYSPYSLGLHTPEMVEEGKRVVAQLVEGAYGSLAQGKVGSHAMPGKTVAEVIDQKLVKSILMIEHMEQAAFQKTPDKSAEVFYVTMAANPDNAYGYAKSSVGALGIAQFMPTTYKNIVTKRPEAGLQKDFEKGMRDLPNALKAQVVLLDSMFASFPKSVREASAQSPARTLEYLAAAYNGGPARVAKAVSSWDQQFANAPQVSLATLRSQHKEMRLKIADLQAKIAATTNATTLAALKKQLAELKVRYAINEDQQENYTQVTLRKETIGYVEKFRKAIEVLSRAESGLSTVSAATAGASQAK